MKDKNRRNFLKYLGISSGAALILPSEIIASEKEELEGISELLGHTYNAYPEKLIVSLDENSDIKLSSIEQKMADRLIETEIRQLKLIKQHIAKAGDKLLHMYNAHTGEIYREVYFSEGKYIKENLKR